jgi:uncharacterized protein (TIGR02145 family)
MKSITIPFSLLLLFSSTLFAQVGISKDGSAADNSAMLDVKSTEHGILLPRISTSGRDLIPSPATGLLIYNTTTNLFNFFNGSSWFQIESTFVTPITGSNNAAGGVSISAEPADLPANSAMLDISDPVRGILMPRTTPGSIASPVTGIIIYNSSTNQVNYFRNAYWSEITATSTGQPGAAGSQSPVGCAIKQDGTAPDPSAMMDVSATDKGLLIPRMTSAQRDAILPATGLTIYNSSSNTIEYFNGTGWYRMNVNFICGNPLEDSRDGQIYNTVQIGTQCWMAESLNYGSRTARDSPMYNNGVAEKYCYENNELNCQAWGALYQWDEAMQYSTVESSQGLCPALWHIPSEAEWVVLDNFLGGKNVAGGKMKEAGTAHWINPNSGATNTSGFTGLGSGCIEYSSTSPSTKLYTQVYFWASTQSGTDNARERSLIYFNASTNPYFNPKWIGFSVRCVKN